MDGLPVKRNDYYLLVGGMVLVCCIPRRGWLFVGGFTALAFGIGWIVMPKRILTVEFKEDYIDESVIRLVRIFGAHRLLNGIILLQGFRSEDRHLQAAGMLSQFVGILPSFISTINYHFQVPAAAAELRGKCMVPFFLWAWGSGYHLLTIVCDEHRVIVTQRKVNAIDNHLMVDSLTTLLASVVWIAFPLTMAKYVTSLPYHEPKPFDSHLSKSIGFFLLGQFLMVALSSAFKRERDKFSVLLGRALMNILVMALLAYSSNVTDNVFANKAVVSYFLLLLFSTTNACLGYSRNEISEKFE